MTDRNVTPIEIRVADAVSVGPGDKLLVVCRSPLTLDEAGRLREELDSHFGAGRVFVISASEDFDIDIATVQEEPA